MNLRCLSLVFSVFLLIVSVSFGYAGAGELSAEEVYSVALKKAKGLHGDAFLTMLSTSVREKLNSKGKSKMWLVTFYSKSANSAVSVTMMNNQYYVNSMKAMPRRQPDPPTVTKKMLNSAKLYKIAVKGMKGAFDSGKDTIVIQLIPMGKNWKWRISCGRKFNKTVNASTYN